MLDRMSHARSLCLTVALLLLGCYADAVTGQVAGTSTATPSSTTVSTTTSTSTAGLSTTTSTITTTASPTTTPVEPHAPTSVTCFNETSSTLTINITSNDANIQRYNVSVVSSLTVWSSIPSFVVIDRANDNLHTIHNLTAGVLYNISVRSLNGNTSSTTTTDTSCGTAPQSSYNLTARPVSSTSIELSWFYYTSNVSQCTEFYISDNSSSSRPTAHTLRCNNSQLQYHYIHRNLTSDKLYSISVIAVSNTSGLYKESSSNSATSWTLPDEVRNVTVTSRTAKSLNLLITPPQNNSNIFGYVLRVQDTNTRYVNLTCNNTAPITQVDNSQTINCSNPFTYNITSLHQNTVYNISIQAANPGGSSDMFNISERTNNLISEPDIDFYSEEAIPSAPTVACVSKTNSSLTINISSTDTNITAYNVTVKSLQSDWDSVPPSANISCTGVVVQHRIDGLSAGVKYNIYVWSLNEDVPSDTSGTTTDRTALNAPHSVTAASTSSTTISVNWTTPSGYYEGFNVNCTGQDDAITRSSTVYVVGTPDNNGKQYTGSCTGVTSGAVYSVIVSAFVNDSLSPPATSSPATNVVTVPDKVQNMTVDGRTPESLNLVITPPANHNDIFKYIVVVEDKFYRQIKQSIELNCINVLATKVNNYCLPYGVGNPKSEEVNCTNYIITYNVTDLEPDTVYNISVQAVNTGGCGDVFSITERTNETYANCSGMQLGNLTSGYDWIEVSWSEPTDPGGVITGYEVTCKDMINDTTQSQSTTGRTIKLQGLHAFTNYSITAKAFTSVGPCPHPPSTTAATDIGPPYSPAILRVEAVDAHTLLVAWSLPSNRSTSDVTYYNVTATDVDNGTTYVNTTTGVYTRQLTVAGLHPYWNYSVNVIAFTNNRTSNIEYIVNATNIIFCLTAESIPGPVTSVNVISLAAESKCYLANVTWQPPTRWDQHGVISGYRIEWERKASGESRNSTEVDPRTFQAQVSVNPNNQPYEFTVIARTSEGFGEPKSTSLDSTGNCPPKPLDNGGVDIFTNTTPPDGESGAKFDDKVSFVVSYDPQVFTSNDNGVVLSQGIIVAEENGSLTSCSDSFDYNFTDFRTWSDVKDMHVIVEYRTTPDAWVASDPNGPTRRKRRQVKASSLQYVVGKDKCSDSQRSYCNGPLHSGRTYRVRAIYCTQSGCYVTKYSSNTFTTKSQESLAWIAGVVIPCILLIVAIVVVVYLWRKNRKLRKYKHDSSARSSVGLSNIQHRRSVPIRVSDFAAEVNEKHRNSNLRFAEEYQGIGEISKTELKHPTTFAELPQNRVKNRYSNILAFDHSRVKLYCADPDDPGADYINANYLRDKNRKRDYIATQGPLPGTVDDFWQMIWEQRVRVIVMVTSLVDKSREKCTKYWPDAAETDAVYGNVQSENKRVYGDITVELQSEKSFSNSFYTIRTFQLTNGHKEQRQVKQFYCDKIPDYGIPDDTDAFLDFIRHVRQTAGQELDPPIVVHCSAGVGRTGTFIALERLLRQIRESDTVDIVQLILDMRNDRHFMVQTEVQFICIHDCLKIAIEKQWHRHAPPPVAESLEPESLYANGPFGREVESPYANLGFENLGYQNDNANGVLVNIDGNVNSKEVSRPAKPPVTSKPSNLRNSTISTKGDSNWPNDKEAVPLTTFTGDGKNRPPVNS